MVPKLRDPNSRKIYFLWFLVTVLIILFIINFVQYILSWKDGTSFVSQENRTADVTRKFQELIIANRRREPLHVPILMYHYVEIVTDERDTIRKSLSIAPTVFEQQISTLLGAGYTPVVMDAVSEYFDGKVRLPQKPVVFTFDDGYRDFYTDVFPILKKHHIRAVLYMVSGFMDKTKNYLTAEQLREIADSGLVEINAHSVNHKNLSLLGSKAGEVVWVKSKHDVESFVDHPVQHFAYPYGAYTPQLEKMAESAGFWTAATTDLGVTQSYQGRYRLTRIRPGRDTGNALLWRIRYN